MSAERSVYEERDAEIFRALVNHTALDPQNHETAPSVRRWYWACYGLSASDMREVGL